MYTVYVNTVADVAMDITKGLNRHPGGVGGLGGLTVGAYCRSVEEEDGLVDDTSTCTSSTDKATDNACGTTGHKWHNTIGGSTAGLQDKRCCDKMLSANNNNLGPAQ